MAQETHISNLVLNKLTKAQFQSIASPAAEELYFIIDDSGLVAGQGITIDQNTTTISLTNTYAGGTAVTLNGTDKSSQTISIYAPTASGTKDTQALVSQGANTTPTWKNIAPSITITDGTNSAAPKINVSVLGRNGTAQSLTTATTGVYGVTKLTENYTSTDNTLAATGKAILAAIATLDVSNITGFGANKTLAALEETDGKISASFQNIAIAGTQITSGTIDLARIPTITNAKLANSTITINNAEVALGGSLSLADLGLENIENTSDLDKPISTATQAALDNKVDKITSTDNAIARYDGTQGDLQNSKVFINDSGSIIIGGTWTDTSSNNPYLQMGNSSTSSQNARLTANNTGAFTFAPSGVSTYLANTTEFRPLSGKANGVDIGSASYPFRTGYFGTSIVIDKGTIRRKALAQNETRSAQTYTLPDATGTIILDNSYASSTTGGVIKIGTGLQIDTNGITSVNLSDLGLSSAMHFIGIALTDMEDGQVTHPTISGIDSYVPVAGDVVLAKDSTSGANQKVEFLYTGVWWELLGQDSSFVIQPSSSTDNAAVRFNGTTGAIQNSKVIIDDNGSIYLTTVTGSVGDANNSRLYFGTPGGTKYSWLSSNTSGAFSLASAGGGFTFYPNTSNYNCLMTNAGSDLGRSDNNGNYAWGNFYTKGSIYSFKGTSGFYKLDFPAKAGTFALTSDLPTKSSWNYDDVYVKYSASQSLTTEQQVQARTNIGAGTSSLTLGTTSSTAYRGDYGNAAYVHAVTNKGAAFASGLYKITTNSEGHVTAATAVVKADITALGIPEADTHYEAHLYAGAASGAANAATTTEQDTYLLLVENNVNKNSIKLVAGNNVEISSTASGEITFTALRPQIMRFI